MRRDRPRVGWGAACAAAAFLALVVSADAHGQAEKKVSNADLFIASFGPSPNETALRASEHGMREQVRLAFYGIDATRVQVDQRLKSESEGASIIDSFQKTIRYFIAEHSKEAWVVASTGQAADIPRIATSMGALLSVARQDALMGREEVAQEAQVQMVRVLTTFSQRFADTCEQQTFPVEVALGLERQNQLMGTGISLMHCARRKYSADIMSQGVQYHFETCTAQGEGTWELTISGLVRGSGKGGVDPSSGHGLWEANTTFRSPVSGHVVSDEWAAFLEMVTEEVEAPPAPVAPPDDAGPQARPNGWEKQPVAAPRQPPKKLTIRKLRMETINMVAGGRGYIGTGPVAEAEIRRGLEQPCRGNER